MKIWIPAVVDNFIKSHPDEEIIRRLITEVAADPTDHLQGQLVYDGRIFKEYKSGGTRIFAVILGEQLVVALFGNHKDKNYVGGTYDGKTKFPAAFNNRNLTANEEELNAIAVIKTIYGLNTTNSPYPIFD